MKRKNKIGNILKKERERRKLTLEEFGHQIGRVSRQRIWQWENGTRNIPAYNLLKVLQVFKINAKVFFDDEENK